jgi:hypothetical protein
MEDNINLDAKEIVVFVCGPYSYDPGPVVGSCEYGNKPSGSIKRQNIFWLAELIVKAILLLGVGTRFDSRLRNFRKFYSLCD